MDQRTAIAVELPRLRRYARSLQHDPGAADDLVQDCVERALSRQHLFRPGTNLRAWLFTILYNLHINTVRGQSKTAERIIASTNGEIGIDDVTEPSQGHAQELRDLSGTLGCLDRGATPGHPPDRARGYELPRASEILGVPVGMVMSRLSRGRDRLRILTNGEESQILRRVK